MKGADHPQRLERARRLADGAGLAGLYVTAGPSFRWLTGESAHQQIWKVGHGVGLGEAYEPPLLQLGNTDPVEEGKVFRIDPGVFSARDTPVYVEDTVVVTATGREALNTYTRELQMV